MCLLVQPPTLAATPGVTLVWSLHGLVDLANEMVILGMMAGKNTLQTQKCRFAEDYNLLPM